MKCLDVKQIQFWILFHTRLAILYQFILCVVSLGASSTVEGLVPGTFSMERDGIASIKNATLFQSNPYFIGTEFLCGDFIKKELISINNGTTVYNCTMLENSCVPKQLWGVTNILHNCNVSTGFLSRFSPGDGETSPFLLLPFFFIPAAYIAFYYSVLEKEIRLIDKIDAFDGKTYVGKRFYPFVARLEKWRRGGVGLCEKKLRTFLISLIRSIVVWGVFSGMQTGTGVDGLYQQSAFSVAMFLGNFGLLSLFLCCTQRHPEKFSRFFYYVLFTGIFLVPYSLVAGLMEFNTIRFDFILNFETISSVFNTATGPVTYNVFSTLDFVFGLFLGAASAMVDKKIEEEKRRTGTISVNEPYPKNHGCFKQVLFDIPKSFIDNGYRIAPKVAASMLS